jgi:4-diphosphocytidyl-2-C-methyl-D-erythritol kinase
VTVLRAHAKINLGLHVTGRRPDGYHDIDTVFHRIEWHDDITLEVSTQPGIVCTCTDPALPVDDRNLCVRAARAVLRLCGSEAGVRIAITKRIPVGAGLGGGSSDAAAVLRGLPPLLGTTVDSGALHSEATALGSDVPYFLGEGAAHATGRGELLTFFTLTLPWSILTVYPDVSVSTAWAYRNLTLRTAPARTDLRALLTGRSGDASALRAGLRNDFETLVLEHHPAVRVARAHLEQAGAVVALMSGSGSAVFGLFPSETVARDAAAALDPAWRWNITPREFGAV